jgi:Icc protein
VLVVGLSLLKVPKLIQISDCHIDDKTLVMGVNSTNNLAKIVHKINKLDFDALLISGDLTHNGTLNSYHILKKILSPINKPIFVITGNHDNPKNLAQAFGNNLFKNFKLGDWEIISINSVQTLKTSGFVHQKNLNQLDKLLLQSNSKHIIVVLHHPIVPMNSSWDDKLSLENPQDLFKILNAHSKIRTVLFGHSHESAQFLHTNFNIISCPSTALQFNQETRIGFNEYNLNNNGTINYTTKWI